MKSSNWLLVTVAATLTCGGLAFSNCTNETSVRSASAKVTAIEADLAVERLKLFERIRPVLSNEQLQKLKDLRAWMDDSVERAIDRSANDSVRSSPAQGHGPDFVRRPAPVPDS